MKPGWLDLDLLAQVEISSEEADYPIESALIPGTGLGWRAAQPGEQTIRLLFDQLLSLRRIHLMFHEGEQEILRQQYNFSPPEAPRSELGGVGHREALLTFLG